MAGWFERDASKSDPVVEFWVRENSDGMTVVVVGERSDGQRFFGSFFQQQRLSGFWKPEKGDE